MLVALLATGCIKATTSGAGGSDAGSDAGRNAGKDSGPQASTCMETLDCKHSDCSAYTALVPAVVCPIAPSGAFDGKCGAYRFQAVLDGYGGTTRYFDAQGKVVAVDETSDAPEFCAQRAIERIMGDAKVVESCNKALAATPNLCAVLIDAGAPRGRCTQAWTCSATHSCGQHHAVTAQECQLSATGSVLEGGCAHGAYLYTISYGPGGAGIAYWDAVSGELLALDQGSDVLDYCGGTSDRLLSGDAVVAQKCDAARDPAIDVCEGADAGVSDGG